VTEGAFTVKVNYQLGTAQVPPGYLPDSGLAFGDRGNGFSYGWSRDITADSRERNAHPDQRYDTLLHLQKGADAIWEIVIPNGMYDVLMVCGDASNTDQTNTMNVENVIVTDPNGQVGNFDKYNVTVTVADGRFTIKPAPGSSNSKICFVDIVLAVAPGAALDPVPADRALDVPQDSVLGWTKGPFAQKHNVYLGTVFADVNTATVSAPLNALVSQGQATTTFEPANGLEFGKTYYWRVDEVNAPPSSAVIKGSVWSFTVEPYAYPITQVTATASGSQANMGPERTVDGSGLNNLGQHSTVSEEMWMSVGAPSWIQYQFDKAYKLHEMKVWNSNQLIESFIGFGAKEVTVETSTDGAVWTPVAGVPDFAQAPGLDTYAANTTVNLGGVVAQYVKLTINKPWGIVPQTGLAEVQFSYVPTAARQPQPTTAAQNVRVDTSLGWRPGREAATHTVYFGTDPNAVRDGTAASQSVTGRSFLPEAMNLGTTYYWRVDEVNTVTYAGSVWSFTTEAYRVVEDFESYNDDLEAKTTIFDTWIDGLTDGRSGSIVGRDTAPFAEQTIVHGGRQSMPLSYSNTGTFSTSEAVRTFDEPQDWTAYGLKSLSLYFQGAAGNGGQLYLKINNTKVPYSGNAADLAKPAWQRWIVDLSTVAGGVSQVTKLTIGVEGSGAGGVLYLDDIQLYPTVFVPITQPIITNVVRANGQAGSRTDASPITAFTGSTAPAPMPLYGLMDEALVFSDRPYPWAQTPAELVGAEYVLTFNTDKNAGETDVTYSVTFSKATTIYLTCDDRIANQQAAVDLVVAAFAKPGQFKNTGLKLYVRENATTDRPMSVFAADLPAGTYVFGAQDSGNNFYTILAKGK
jgi:hypothetical protein